MTSYLAQLTEDEARYVCSLIPYERTIRFFQDNPKEFAKIRPGFRAKTLSKADASKLLFSHRSRGSVSHLIETHISNWLSEIQEHISKMMEEGESKEAALLHTFPFCFFADGIGVFFKLVGEEYPEEYVALLSAAITELKKIKELDCKQKSEQKELLEALNIKESDVKKLQTELASTKSELNKTLDEHSKEIETFKCNISDLEKLRAVLQNDEGTIASLKTQIRESEKTIERLSVDLSEIKDNNQQLAAQIQVEIEKQQAIDLAKRQSARKAKRPRDLSEFKDYLGYNLENIGVCPNSGHYALLKEHLCETLFQGIPVVVNRGAGISLMDCIANALIGTTNINTLRFNKDLLTQNIDDFLSEAGRIVCLDNFLGNYNETELLPLFENHRNKIVFLTLAYDRTLQYVSEEFLRYCQYLNLNRIAALSVNTELTEAPSTIDEEEYEPQWIDSNKQYSAILKKILQELSYCESLIERKCAGVFDDQDVCRILAFEVLPYCVDVLRIAPYNTSEKFLKYARRCPYRNLLEEWFAR
jgi:hypothetical protein